MLTDIKQRHSMSEKINKRKDPNYKQVIGYVHIDTTAEFRSICTKKGLTVSEAMEQALIEWIEKNRS